MPDQLVVFITGVGRGIGNALARAYITRPNCTVIGSIRHDTTPSVASLQSYPTGENSKLILVKIESASPTDASKAVQEIEALGITHIDIVIPNAGVSPPIDPLEIVDLKVMTITFQINTLGPLALYQACLPLLKNSKNPKFMPISSAAGTIGGMERGKTFVAPSYCISKAALNWITLAAHCGNEWLIAVAINPGLVATDMGNQTARYIGLEKAPWTAEQSAEKIIDLIEKSSRENYSGKFMDAIKGTELPW